MSAKLQPADRVIRFVERNGVWWWEWGADAEPVTPRAYQYLRSVAKRHRVPLYYERPAVYLEAALARMDYDHGEN